MNMCTEIAGALGIEENVARAVIGEFALQLHRHALEYRGINGDFIGEDLRLHIDAQLRLTTISLVSWIILPNGTHGNLETRVNICSALASVAIGNHFVIRWNAGSRVLNECPAKLRWASYYRLNMSLMKTYDQS